MPHVREVTISLHEFRHREDAAGLPRMAGDQHELHLLDEWEWQSAKRAARIGSLPHAGCQVWWGKRLCTFTKYLQENHYAVDTARFPRCDGRSR